MLLLIDTMYYQRVRVRKSIIPDATYSCYITWKPWYGTDHYYSKMVLPTVRTIAVRVTLDEMSLCPQAATRWYWLLPLKVSYRYLKEKRDTGPSVPLRQQSGSFREKLARFPRLPMAKRGPKVTLEPLRRLRMKGLHPERSTHIYCTWSYIN